jgi:hypothetical protein
MAYKEDITISQPKPWAIYRKKTPSSDWAEWHSFTHRALFRRVRPFPTSTPRSRNGGYEYPSNYHRFSYTSSGSPGDMQQAIDLWPYNGSEDRFYSTRLAPVTNNYIGPSGGGFEYYGCSSTFPYYPLIPTALSSRVRSRLLGRLRNNQFDAGTALGEVPETLRSIGSSTRNAKKRIASLRRFPPKTRSKLRHLSVRKLRKIPTAAARGYLSVIFGVLPLMRDIYSLMDYLDNGLKDVRFSITIEDHDESFGPPSNLSYQTTYSGEFNRGMKESVTLSLVNPSSFNLWRLGLTDPLSVSWELVTLSFIVDWFTHLGDFISGLSPKLGIIFKHGYSSRWCHITTQIECKYRGGVQSHVVRYGPDKPMKVSVHQRSFRREVLVGIVPPLPYVDLGLDIKQIITAVALITAKG